MPRAASSAGRFFFKQAIGKQTSQACRSHYVRNAIAAGGGLAIAGNELAFALSDCQLALS